MMYPLVAVGLVASIRPSLVVVEWMGRAVFDPGRHGLLGTKLGGLLIAWTLEE